MPSSTPRQARTMAAAAHNAKFARKVGIPMKVAREFNKADAAHDLAAALRKHKPAPKGL